MSAPHIGHRVVSVLAGVLLAGTALAAPALAAGHQAGPGPAAFTTQEGPAAAAFVHKGRVIAKPALNVRQNPNTSRPPVGSIPFGTVIELDCKVNGQSVEGNPRWYLLKDHSGWVAARWVENINAAPGKC
ncbi:SH3 domain-containing protein [Streptomyces sp. NPDC006645]|uniref:SH3 domain-containing protein n=1 Tax=unclassified Streptomyces TaxID=2593676 RepID=UPI0033A62C91